VRVKVKDRKPCSSNGLEASLNGIGLIRPIL
jgi:hypothetical protein